MEKEVKEPIALIRETDVELKSEKKTFNIPINSIKKTILLKKRKHKTLINFSILLILLTLLISPFIEKSNLPYFYTSLILFLGLIVIFKKDYDYTFLIIKEYDLIEIKIKKRDIPHIKKFEQLLKQKLA